MNRSFRVLLHKFITINKTIEIIFKVLYFYFSVHPTVTSIFPEEVKLCKSSLPSADYGVAAQRFIAMGKYFGPYKGKEISVKEGLEQIIRGDNASFLRAVGNSFIKLAVGTYFLIEGETEKGRNAFRVGYFQS